MTGTLKNGLQWCKKIACFYIILITVTVKKEKLFLKMKSSWHASAEQNYNNSVSFIKFFHHGRTNILILVHKVCYLHFSTPSSFWGDRFSLLGIVPVPEWRHFWQKDGDGWTVGRKQRYWSMSGCVQQMDVWVSASTRLLIIAISVLQQFFSLLSFYLCQSEKTQVGCLSTCVFVTLSNLSIVQIQGCYYYCTISSGKDVITGEVARWIPF